MHYDRVTYRNHGFDIWQVGDVNAAIAALEASLEMEVEDINAMLQRESAEQMLQTIRKSGTYSMFWAPPPGQDKKG